MLLMVPACGEPDRGPTRAPEDTICVDHSRLSAAALNKQRSQAVAAAHAIAKQSNTGLLPSDRAGTDAEATRTTFSRLRYALNKYGTLRVLYSTKLALVVAGAKTSAPEQTARLFLDAHPALLGLDTVKDTLVLRQIKKRPAGGHYVTFGQQHQGVDCEGTFVTVLLDGQARVKGFVGDVLPGITASPVASVNAAAAVAKVGAIKAAGPHTATGSPQLVYADQPRSREVHLAWRVHSSDSGGRAWQHLVDAASGTILVSRSRRQPGQDPLKELYHSGTLVRSGSASSYYCSTCTPDPYDEPACKPCSLNLKEGQAWSHMADIADYWQSRFGRQSYDGANAVMQTNLEYITPLTWSGYFDPNTFQVHVNDYHADVTMDTMAHEWQHALFNAEIGEPQGGDPGAINEGFSFSFSLVMDNDWHAGSRSARDPLYGPCRPLGPQPHGYRDYCWDSQGGPIYDDYYYNGALIMQSCYLVFGDGAPPASCAQQTDCPGDTAFGDTYCACRSDADGSCTSPGARHCVKVRNQVRVPYRGQHHGWAPYHFAQVNGFLHDNTQLYAFPDALELAACEYDLSLSPPRDCDFTGLSVRQAMLAQGFWEQHLEARQEHVGDGRFWTDRRPALLSNLYPTSTTCTPPAPPDYSSTCPAGQACDDGYCTGDRRLAMFYRASDRTDGHEEGTILYNDSLNGRSFGYRTPVLEGSSGEHVFAGSGITAVRDPAVSGSKELALVYKARDDDTIRYILADLSASLPPAWADEQTVATSAATDATPMGINYDGSLYFIYKQAGGTALKYILAGETVPVPIPGASSSMAPSAVVAAGRLWVFFRGTGAISEGDTSVYYTSYNGSSWTAVQQLATVEPNQVLMTQFRPESRYYAGRIWLFLTTAGGWGLSQVSFLPTGSGGVSGLSPTVALRQTDYLWDPDRTYTATVQHGEHLRLYYSYAGGSTWHIAKAGEG